MSSVYPLKSKKKLFDFLSEHTGDPSFKEKGLSRKGVINETYGKNSHIYLWFKQPSEAHKIHNALRLGGFKVSENYLRTNEKAVDVHVSYFKGFHWDE